MLKKSMDILNKNILLISLGTLLFFPQFLIIRKSFLSLVITVIYTIVACGIYSSLWQYSQENKYNFIKGLKDNFLRYLGVFIVLMLVMFLVMTPIFFIVALLGNAVFMPSSIARCLYALMAALFSILTVFTMSYVFSKRRGIDAIIDAVKYIKKNYKTSHLPMGLAFCYSIISFLLSKLSNSILYFPLNIVLLLAGSFAVTYLTYLAFLVASFDINKGER
ncbi:MAG: hypothetical protein ABH848_03090 [Candidatus Omnitrophota bacterium]